MHRVLPGHGTRSWLTGYVHAFNAMGGVTDIMVPDNCTTAVDRGPAKRGARSGDKPPTEANDAYSDFADCCGCAIVPARVRAPRNKSHAEKGVDICEAWALAPLAGEVFHSLGELSEAVWERVAWIDARPFQQREGSRDSVFEEAEKLLLPT